ncbi:MAG: hypothetical protein V1917_02420 [Candidatus Gottesmanbacteria bacterium]
MIYATIISRIFEPVILFLVLFAVTLSRAALTTEEIILYCSVVLLGIVFPTIGLLLYAMKKKKISSWDISNRQERVKALSVFLVFLIIGVILISFLGHATVTRFFLLFGSTYIGFFLVTLWFKISGHLTVATLFVGSMMYWFGGYTWALVFVLPILAWSRVLLKRHTVFQVITGTFYGACIVGAGIYWQLL